MARETNTRELVREIAAAALNRGEKPTQAMIRKVILEEHGRTASPNVVMNELNSILVDSASINAKRFTLPGLPAEVSEAMTSVWSVACEKSNELVAGKVQEVEQREIAAEQSIRSIEGKLAAEKTMVIGLQHDIVLSNQSLEQKAVAINELRNELHESRAKLDVAIERNAEIVADKIRIEAAGAQRITEIELNNRSELERIRAEHEKTVEQLKHAHLQEAITWDGLRKHLLNQTDQIRQTAREKDEDQRARIADFEIRTAMLTRKANDAQDEGSRMRGVIETLQVQIGKLEAREKTARESLVLANATEKDRFAAIEKWLGVTVAPEVHQEFLKEFKLNDN